ncbi:uncharacterized protein LOC114360055 [Ostrinia furnacalis]|uniref:uncharacterized protein LOC114360055 n=1 Tax=Ostrinia furnacalis TaxID=93504 RepID=UPI0010392710|nr:uncharacterized protein LOC114360055 [Ostrinia furnacalis]
MQNLKNKFSSRPTPGREASTNTAEPASLMNSAENVTAESDVTFNSAEENDADNSLLTNTLPDRRSRSPLRKRQCEGFYSLGGASDSESEGSPIPKISTATRGKKSSRHTSSSTKRFTKTKGTKAEEEGCNRASKTKTRSTTRLPKAQSLESVSGIVCPDIPEEPSLLDMTQLRDIAHQCLSAVTEVKNKSRHLQGTMQKTLKQAQNVLQVVIDEMAERTLSGEARKTARDNKNLRKEKEELTKEVQSLRRSLSERVAATPAAAPSTTPPAKTSSISPMDTTCAPSTDATNQETLLLSLGKMIEASLDARFARLEGMQDRLNPMPVSRPPLAADSAATVKTVAKKKAAKQLPMPPTPAETSNKTYSMVAAASTASQNSVKAAPKTVPKPTNASKLPANAGPSRPPESRRNVQRPETQPPTTSAVQAASSAEQWTKVSHKKRKKNKKNSSQSSSAPQNVPSRIPKSGNRSKGGVSLTPPRTSAVVISLQPEAVEKGASYGEAIKKAREVLSLDELGMDHVRCRRTATGARMLEISGSQSGEKADQLAVKLNEVLEGVARVARPVRRVGLRITELDDSVSKEEVIEAIAAKTGCQKEAIKAGEIRPGPRGVGAILVSCPVTAAQVLSTGRLLVGWSSARVSFLESRPLRCFKCLGLGHTKQLCPSSSTRNELCFRCGHPGHKSTSCSAKIRCAVCADAGKASDHIMGGKSCRPRPVRGKAPLVVQIPTTPVTSGVQSQSAEMETTSVEPYDGI